MHSRTRTRKRQAMDVDPTNPHTGAMRAVLEFAIALLISGAAAGCRGSDVEPVEPAEPTVEQPQQPFLARRAAHRTVLSKRGPSPGKYLDYTPPPGVFRTT